MVQATDPRELLAPVPAVTEPAVAPAEPAAQVTEPVEPDYKAELAAIKAKLAEAEAKTASETQRLTDELNRKEQALRSTQGELRKRQNLERDMADLKAEVSRIGGVTQAVAERTASGQTENLPEDLARINRETTTSQQKTQFQRELERAWGNVSKVSMNLGLEKPQDLATYPEMQEAVQAWQDAYQRQDVAGLHAAAADIASASLTLPKRVTAAVPTPTTPVVTPVTTPAESAVARPAARTQAALNPQASGAQRGTDAQSLVNKLARGEYLAPADMVKAKKAMDEQGIYPD